MNKFRIMVKVGKTWKMGLNDYDSYDLAAEREKELNNIGIKSKIVSSDLLYSTTKVIAW